MVRLLAAFASAPAAASSMARAGREPSAVPSVRIAASAPASTSSPSGVNPGPRPSKVTEAATRSSGDVAVSAERNGRESMPGTECGSPPIATPRSSLVVCGKAGRGSHHRTRLTTRPPNSREPGPTTTDAPWGTNSSRPASDVAAISTPFGSRVASRVETTSTSPPVWSHTAWLGRAQHRRGRGARHE